MRFSQSEQQDSPSQFESLYDMYPDTTKMYSTQQQLHQHHHQHHQQQQQQQHQHQPSAMAGGGAKQSFNKKRIRTIFTPEQLKRLEQEFSNQMYLVGQYRCLLAESLNLSEAQVKVWFQNRRIKFRKLNTGPASK